jgi:hypothetical protein
MNLTQLFCDIDDYVKALNQSTGKNNFLITHSKSSRGTAARMSLSELMTILVLYHSSGFKNFKYFYFYLLQNHRGDFPQLLSYSRFVEWIPYCLLPLTHFLKTNFAPCSGISFIDSTSISVCRNIRINRNKVFKGIANRGKTSMGWFFGLKLHLIVNEKGDILNLKITAGNTHDKVPVKDLCSNLFGKLYGDKGYLGSKLFEELFSEKLELITNIRGNMKNKLLKIYDKLMLRKRFIIETIFDQLKNISDIEHSRHRSPTNFLVNLIAGLVSYTYQEKKPSITMPNQALAL